VSYCVCIRISPDFEKYRVIQSDSKKYHAVQRYCVTQYTVYFFFKSSYINLIYIVLYIFLLNFEPTSLCREVRSITILLDMLFIYNFKYITMIKFLNFINMPHHHFSSPLILFKFFHLFESKDSYKIFFFSSFEIICVIYLR
jgi:hypothetical protein